MLSYYLVQSYFTANSHLSPAEAAACKSNMLTVMEKRKREMTGSLKAGQLIMNYA